MGGAVLGTVRQGGPPRAPPARGRRYGRLESGILDRRGISLLSMSRVRAFGLLILVQAAHSTEEYLGRLWETFPPARLVSSLLSDDPERGFIAANVVLLAFGVWTWAVPVQREWPSPEPLVWFWVVLELINGSVHVLWAVRQGGYVPGVATAPFLLAAAFYLARKSRT